MTKPKSNGYAKLAAGEMYGRLVRHQKMGYVVLSETVYAPNSTTREHAHENAHFCLLIKGAFTEICWNKTLECRPSSLSYLVAGEAHRDHFLTTSRCFIVDIAPALMERARDHGVRLDESANFQDRGLSNLAFKLHREFYQKDAAARLAAEGLALELIAEASRRPTDRDQRAPHWLERAKDLLHSRFSENLTHDEIAAEVSVHPVHLAREFRRHYQCTIGEFVRMARIEHARLKISTSELPILQIALNAGFFDQSHFTRAFKRIVGMTPAEYRAYSRGR